MLPVAMGYLPHTAPGPNAWRWVWGAGGGPNFGAAGAYLANPHPPININYLYDFNDQQPHAGSAKTFMASCGWACCGAAFLSSHRAWRKIFAAPPGQNP